MMKRGLYVNEQRTDHNIFARALVHCLGAHRGRDFNWGDPQLELALRPHWYAGCPPPQQRIPAGGVLPAGRPFDRGEHLGICAEIEIRGISMKLNCKRIDFTYTPGEEIFNFPEESGLPFIFDVEEELTGDPAVMDAVGEMLDETEKLAEKAKAAIKAALADEDSRYHSVVTFFMEFHRDDVGPDIVAELFPGTDPAKLSFAEMVDFLKLKRFGSLVDSEMNQQVFILDLSFNPEITDELMVIYFDLNKEIFCITHES